VEKGGDMGLLLTGEVRWAREGLMSPGHMDMRMHSGICWIVCEDGVYCSKLSSFLVMANSKGWGRLECGKGGNCGD
jgi:hypothetical protein